MARQTWETEERRILEWLGDRELASDEPMVVSSVALATELGFDNSIVVRVIDSLVDADYVRGEIGHAINNEVILMAGRLTERGRREVGQWPASGYDDLVAAIKQLVDAEADPEKKSRLRALADGITAAGRDIVVAVLTDWAKKQSGL